MSNNECIAARSYTNTVTGRWGDWVGEVQSALSVYTQPVMVGLVMSYNDPGWSVFWSESSGFIEEE